VLFINILAFILSGLIVWKKGYLKIDSLRGAIRKKRHVESVAARDQRRRYTNVCQFALELVIYLFV
jgi:hypothetical protein